MQEQQASKPKNTHRKRQFGTLDLVVLVALCGTVSTVVGASIAGFLHDTRPVRAQSMAESLAQQISQQHEIATHPVKASRGPASVEAISETTVPPLTDGPIGRDPWGRPYHYSVITDDAEATVVVWSSGPNGQEDTDVSVLHEMGAKKFKFKGDDIGFVHKR